MLEERSYCGVRQVQVGVCSIVDLAGGLGQGGSEIESFTEMQACQMMFGGLESISHRNSIVNTRVPALVEEKPDLTPLARTEPWVRKSTRRRMHRRWMCKCSSERSRAPEDGWADPGQICEKNLQFPRCIHKHT